jgi:hypothetical protein
VPADRPAVFTETIRFAKLPPAIRTFGLDIESQFWPSVVVATATIEV